MADVIRRKLRELEPGRSVYAIAPLQEQFEGAAACALRAHRAAQVQPVQPLRAG